MTFQPTPRQALVLWSLVVAAPGEEPSRSTVRPRLTAGERRQLLDAALIEEEKRGRGHHLLLAEKGWQWAETQRPIKLSLSANATPVLEKLIAALVHYLSRTDGRLADVISTAPPTVAPSAVAPGGPAGQDRFAVDPAERIRATCLALSGGQMERRIRLADLRRALGDLTRENVDQTLRAMDRSRLIQLMALETPAEISSEDREAAITIAGRALQLVYLTR